MRLFKGMGLAALGTIGFVGCADEQLVQTTPQGLKVAVAPLTLPGIANACYDILVENGGGPALSLVGGNNDVVVLGTPNTYLPTDTATICSSTYGNGLGGDITYIAPCDASSDSDGATTGNQNSVTIWPELYVADDTYGTDAGNDPDVMQEWQNPCDTTPGGTVEGCQLHFNCNENEDTLVEFNFTIMRDANQGFFDVAVNFEDIFCSAKVDCKYDTATGTSPDDIIRLVHTIGTAGAPGTRTATAVLGFACTDGDSSDDTRLYLSQVQVGCDVQGDGLAQWGVPALSGVAETDSTDNVFYNINVNTAGNVFSTEPAGPVAQAMVFQGEEALLNGTNGDADKMYWNVAVGFNEVSGGTQTAATLTADGANCWMRAYGTASKGSLASVLGKTNVSYPYIGALVKLTDNDEKLICDQFDLGTNNAAVAGTSQATWVDTFYANLAGFDAMNSTTDGLAVDSPTWWEMVSEGAGLTVSPFAL